VQRHVIRQELECKELECKKAATSPSAQQRALQCLSHTFTLSIFVPRFLSLSLSVSLSLSLSLCLSWVTLARVHIFKFCQLCINAKLSDRARAARSHTRESPQITQEKTHKKRPCTYETHKKRQADRRGLCKHRTRTHCKPSLISHNSYAQPKSVSVHMKGTLCVR